MEEAKLWKGYVMHKNVSVLKAQSSVPIEVMEIVQKLFYTLSAVDI